MMGKTLNAGQTCIAPDYVLVQQSKEGNFIEAYAKQVSKLYGENPELSADYARIISDKHFDRIKGLLDDAITKGATVKVGGQTNATTRYIAPTLLTNVTPDMKIMQEEIFGPLMPMMTFDQLEEVPPIINSRPKALTMYINSKQQKNINYLINHPTSGGAVIKDYLLGYVNPNLPFGGVNNSGIGKSLGHHGFLDFTNERGIIHRRFLDLTMAYPPYTDKVRRLVKAIYRWL
jgi:aldehyde dehydrogenase (NAD+)